MPGSYGVWWNPEMSAARETDMNLNLNPRWRARVLRVLVPDRVCGVWD